MKNKKKLLGFSFYINIGNFEAFIWNLNLSTNCLFWRCEYLQKAFFGTYVLARATKYLPQYQLLTIS